MPEYLLKLVRDPLEDAIYHPFPEATFEIIPDPIPENSRYRQLSQLQVDKEGPNGVHFVTDKVLLEKVSAYTGIEPSGNFHWGTEVALQPLMALEKRGIRPVFLNATVHAYLNNKGNWDQIDGYAQDLSQVIRSIFVAPDIIDGRDFQFGPYSSKTPSEHGEKAGDTNRYTQIFFDVLKIPMKEMIDATSGILSERAEVEAKALHYAAMQVADMRYLWETENMRVAIGGIDQRKLHKLSWDYFGGQGWEYPIAIHSPILISLKGEIPRKGKYNVLEDRIYPVGSRVAKMSKSVGEKYTLFLNDSAEDVRRKLKSAACPPYSEARITVGTEEKRPLEDNPVAQLVKLVINPHMKTLKVERDPSRGGDVDGNPMEILELYKQDKIMPSELKRAVAEAMVELNRQVGLPPRKKEEL